MTKISNNKPETEKMNIEHRTSNIERRMKDKKVEWWSSGVMGKKLAPYRIWNLRLGIWDFIDSVNS